MKQDKWGYPRKWPWWRDGMFWGISIFFGIGLGVLISIFIGERRNGPSVPLTICLLVPFLIYMAEMYWYAWDSYRWDIRGNCLTHHSDYYEKRREIIEQLKRRRDMPF